MSTKAKGVPVWTDAFFNIPAQFDDADKLTNRITTLVNLFVSEDWFKKDDWIFLKSWMLDNKNQINSVTFRALTISLKNLKYIRGILVNNKKLKTIEIKNFAVQNDEAFKDFCDMISQFRKLDRIRITIDGLSNERLNQLKSSVNSSIKQIELIREPVYMAYSDDYIIDHVAKKKKFLIGMKTIDFIKTNHIGWGFFNALRNSPALEHVSVQSAMLNARSLSLAVDAIAESKSITSVAIGLADQATIQRLFTTDRIKQVSVVGSYDQNSNSLTALRDILTRPSLTSLMIESGFSEEPTVLYTIPNITELNIVSDSSRSISTEVLAKNTWLKNLTLYGGKHKNFDNLSPMIFGQLTSLSLSNLTLKTDISAMLKNSTSLTELSIRAEGSWPSGALPTPYEGLADILEVNSTLKSLNLAIMPREPLRFFERFVQGWQKNTTLTQLRVKFTDFSVFYDQMADALLENQTLTSLTLDGPAPWEHSQKIRNALQTNKALLSLTCNGLDSWSDAVLVLRSNTALKTLNLHALFDKKMDKLLQSLEQVLETNMALTEVSLSEGTFNKKHIPLPDRCQQMLRRNYVTHHRSIDSIYSVITMIALRPDLFTSILPLEIWIMVFKHINLPSCNINFAKKLVAALDARK